MLGTLALVASAGACAQGASTSHKGKVAASDAGNSMDAGKMDAGKIISGPPDTGTPVGDIDAMLSPPMGDAETEMGEGGPDAACGTACCDGIKESSSPTFESDVDCGGPVCRKCLEGETCIANTDCESKICNAGKTCDATPDAGMPVNNCAGKPAGTACTDADCVTNTMCDALGNCGTVGNCATSPDSNCNKSTNAGHAYWVCDDNQEWSNARAKCTAVGMDLAHVDDMAENDFLKDAINNDASGQAWLGLTVMASAWSWSDDMSAPSFMHWNGGSTPSADSGQCGYGDDNGDWYSDDCTNSYGYVCEAIK